MARRAVAALPNVVSLSRLVLAAAFVGAPETATRVTLVVAAAVTDFLDGFLARRLRGTSRAGALIDPIADRAFALVAVSTLLAGGALTTLQYFVILSRDLMTAVGFVVARNVARLRDVQFKARAVGKVVTTLQFLVLIAALEHPRWVTPLVVTLGVASALAIADYSLALWRARTP
ncbi:MAG TPA: CDP-alcohol phosphatidyltransferase family protein [Gemmatimonadaceae bacterium]|nr:CDP-alcohol phosphatidyltransferase family protein [Gemmatimonadaceae bacterium]